MNFCARKLTMLLAVALAAEISFSARAEDGIIFSKLTNAVENTDSLLAPPRPQAQFAPPSQPFDFDPGLLPAAPLPVPDNSLRESLNARKNWMFMTPEEILGVPTPEKILGLPEDPSERDLTPEQKFLKRQEQASTLSASNNWQGFNKVFLNKDSDDAFQSLDQKKEWDLRSGSDTVPVAGSTKYLNQFLNAPESPASDAENRDSTWGNAFDSYTPEKNEQQLEAQKEAMERFREMMQPPADAAAPNQKFSAPPRDPNLQEVLQDNPAGHAFARMQSGILKPTGIDPLANATGAHKQTVKKSVLESESDLPPWLRDGPQPGIPQRKF
jgi:hypothetical protein